MSRMGFKRSVVDCDFSTLTLPSPDPACLCCTGGATLSEMGALACRGSEELVPCAVEADSSSVSALTTPSTRGFLEFFGLDGEGLGASAPEEGLEITLRFLLASAASLACRRCPSSSAFLRGHIHLSNATMTPLQNLLSTGVADFNLNKIVLLIPEAANGKTSTGTSSLYISATKD